MMLSIVIATFNEEKLLPRLLASIKEQSFTDYEIIVADNYSTDRTRHIATKYGAKIVDGGLPGRSRNCGAAVAEGNIILFLDADVMLDEDFLQDVITEFRSKNYGIAACRITPISDRKLDKLIHSGYNGILLLTAGIRPFAPGFCIIAKRDAHVLMNGFDESILLGEDSDYAWRGGKIAKFGVVKSHNILVSVRRFDRDGRWNVLFKYILSGLYMMVIGKIKTDIFKYTFGHK